MNSTKPFLLFALPAISFGEDGGYPSAAWLVCSPVSPGLDCANPTLQAAAFQLSQFTSEQAAVALAGWQ